jgi:hypothetical protein
MGPRDALAFTERIKALCGLFKLPYSSAIDDAYFRAVQDLDATAVYRALDVLATTSRFLPKPVELREAALAAGNSSIATRCPAGAKLFAPRYPVDVAGYGVVARIGEHGGYAVRDGSTWIVSELVAATGNGARELWRGGPASNRVAERASP